MCVNSNTVAGWEMALPKSTRAWNKLARVFCIQSALNGMPVPCNIFLCQGEIFTLSDPNAEFDEVVTCDEFSDGVLHLDTWVDFEEVEISIGVS